MSKNLFNSVKMFKPNRNLIDLSHDVKASMQMGNLYPSCVIRCVPGDKFSLTCESLVRFAPMVAPMMHRVNVFMHYFFVPYRLLWDNWENFITHTKVSGAIPAAPFVNYDAGNYSVLLDHLGLPKPIPAMPSEKILAFDIAAYQLVCNEYYRDQNLMQDTSDLIKLVDGDNNSKFGDLSLIRQRCWEHDYFTSALPFPQKGDAVGMPVSGDVTLKSPIPNDQNVWWKDSGTWAPAGSGDLKSDAGDLIVNDGIVDRPAVIDPDGTLEVNNVNTTINDLRRAMRLQVFLEKLARGGSRYFETIKSMFGINSPDKRLQRPEYITGTKSPVVISEVLNTTGTDDLPQGNMSGHGVSVTSGQYGSYYCEEHGVIIGIQSVMPLTAYQQGINRHWLKFDPLDFYFPDFANIGEQEIQNRELYAFNGPSAGDGTFGYVPRYAEYKFETNRVAGQFRDTLSYWHMGRIFDAPPVLNGSFVASDPTQRVFAVIDPAFDQLYVHTFHKIKGSRPMPIYGTPSF